MDSLMLSGKIACIREVQRFKMPQLKLLYDLLNLREKGGGYIKKGDMAANLLDHINQETSTVRLTELIRIVQEVSRQSVTAPPPPPPLGSLPPSTNSHLATSSSLPAPPMTLPKQPSTSIPEWARAQPSSGSQPSQPSSMPSSSQTGLQPPPPGSVIRCLCVSGSNGLGSYLQCKGVGGKSCGVYQHESCCGQSIVSQCGKASRPFESWGKGFGGYMCERCRSSICDPFFELLPQSQGDLIPMALMRRTNTNILVGATNKPQISIERSFQLSREKYDLLIRHGVKDGLYRIQVVCLCLSDTTPNRYHWPTGTKLKINGQEIRTNNRQPHVKLGANGRDDAVDITPHCLSRTIEVSCVAGDARTFVIGVQLVSRRSIEAVKRLMPLPQTLQDSMSRIRSHLSSSEDIEIHCSKVSLKDPMTGSRIKRAVRYSNSSSILCFDLDTCLNITFLSKKWQCPHSLMDSYIFQLTSDSFIQAILDSLSRNEEVTEIEVSPDAKWRPAGSKGPFLAPGEPYMSMSATGISIDDDEEEDEMESVRQAAKAMSTKRSFETPSGSKRKREENEVIVIDDD